MNKDNNEKKRGRPALVSDADFIKVLTNSNNPNDVIQAFSFLREMPLNKAKLYVAMRATALRKKLGKNVIKTFPRGRKTSNKPQMVANAEMDIDVDIEDVNSIPTPSTRHFFEE